VDANLITALNASFEIEVADPDDTLRSELARAATLPARNRAIDAQLSMVIGAAQVTIDGAGTVSFSCDNQQTLFGTSERIDAPGWSHWLTIDGKEIPLTVAGSTFILPPDVVRLARSATQIGYRMKPPVNDAPSIDYAVDIDGKSASVVRSFLGNCLRGQG